MAKWQKTFSVHFGDEKTRTEILKMFYAQQEGKLKKAGIPITLEELLMLDKKEKE